MRKPGGGRPRQRPKTCKTCGFIAKNNTGLAAHERKHRNGAPLTRTDGAPSQLTRTAEAVAQAVQAHQQAREDLIKATEGLITALQVGI